MSLRFYSKIAGISHDNDDGSSRQFIASLCRDGERLRLERDHANQFDRWAVAVLRNDGQQLGFLSSHVAAEIGPMLDRGGYIVATISEVTGGEGEHFGINILVHAANRPGDWLDDRHDDLSFLDSGEADKIESRRARRLNRSLFYSIKQSIRRLFR